MFVFKTLQFCRTYVQSMKPLLSAHHLLLLVNSWRISTKKCTKKITLIISKYGCGKVKICIMSIAHIILRWVWLHLLCIALVRISLAISISTK